MESNLSLLDLVQPENAGRAFRFQHLKAAGIVNNYMSLKRWVERGFLPEPRRLPNGAPYWLGADLAESKLGEELADRIEASEPEPEAA